MIKTASKKRGHDEFFTSYVESGTEGRLSQGSQPVKEKSQTEPESAKPKEVFAERPTNFKRPAEIQMSGMKRKRLEISDVDSQKATAGQENVVDKVEFIEEPVEKTGSSFKKRVAKQSEKSSSKSNAKAKLECELNITVATAATLVSAKSKAIQKVAVKEVVHKQEDSKDMSSIRRSSSRLQQKA